MVEVGRQTDRGSVFVRQLGPALVQLLNKRARGVLVREQHELGARGPPRRAVLANDFS